MAKRLRSTKALALLTGTALTGLAAVYVWHRHTTAPTPADHWALIDKYCVVCHNDIELAGGVAFDRLDHDNLHGDAKLWETAIRKLRGHLMPPPGEPRPADARELLADHVRHRILQGFLQQRGVMLADIVGLTAHRRPSFAPFLGVVACPSFTSSFR